MMVPAEGVPGRGLEGHLRRRRHRLDQARRRRQIYAINPEAGFFGVAPGTAYATNPNAMESIEANTIFTNVALTDDGDVWWEGMDGEPPAHAIDWQGNDWTPDSDNKAAHPNARFTAPAAQNARSWTRAGTTRRACRSVPSSSAGAARTTVPLVVPGFNWAFGVYMAATMGSEMTAAAFGQQGVVRRDPLAMLPFRRLPHGQLPQSLAGLRAQHPESAADLRGQLVPQATRTASSSGPASARTCASCSGSSTVPAGVPWHREPLGWMPRYEDIDWEGLEDFSEEDFYACMAVDRKEWEAELLQVEELFMKLHTRLPTEMQAIRSLTASALWRSPDHWDMASDPT
jgi:phosphoenolpyruvate carboxykinase (GTP)